MSTSPSSSTKMQDIADRLNLSVATVSRALRKVPGINPQTRARVMQAASEVGYRLPSTYRGATEEPDSLQHIGILLETRNNQVPHPYLTGLSEASLKLNASLVIHYVKPGECESMLDPKMQPSAMRSGLLSGLILIFWWPRHVVEGLSKKFPTVSIMHKYAGLDVDTVGIDHEGGMELLVHRLYNHGHRKIAFIGRCSKLHWSNARFAGYVAALSAHDIEYNPDWVIDVDFEAIATADGRWEGSESQVNRILSQGVTAFVCATEPSGRDLHRMLTEKGLNIPGDISVTGFHRPSDSIPPGLPDLTSVGASYEAIGAAALKRLILRISNPAETSRTILFPCEYYPGSTIGPATGK